MHANNVFTLSRFTALTPKLTMIPKNRSVNIDVAALLKKNGVFNSSKNDDLDIVEITNSPKKADTLVEDKNDVIELAKYVSKRNKEIRESIPKPIPPEIAMALPKTDPEMARQKVLAAKFQSIYAKMHSGKQLSSEDMKFLKENYPDVYLVAMRVEREREQLQRQLQRCSTKEERMQVINQKRHYIASIAQYTPEKDEMGMLFLRSMFAAIDEEVKHLDDA